MLQENMAMKYSSMFCCCAPLQQCSRDKKKYSCLQSVSRAEPRAGFHVFLEGFTLRWCFYLAFIGIYEHQQQVGSCHPDHVWMKITNRRTELPACSLPVFQPCIPPSPKLAGSSQVPAAVKLSRET